jgi:predicted unusual protein kinase regulating ubiquinone biosynthesis (AarF/ABC1/UbiB family)
MPVADSLPCDQSLATQGCSKTLTDPQRASLARLYVALGRRDEEGVYRAAVEMGIRTRNMDRKVIVNFVTHFFDRDMT